MMKYLAVLLFIVCLFIESTHAGIMAAATGKLGGCIVKDDIPSAPSKPQNVLETENLSCKSCHELHCPHWNFQIQSSKKKLETLK
jgi:hypothetical protein